MNNKIKFQYATIFYYILYCYPSKESITPQQHNVFLLIAKHAIFKTNPNSSTQTIPAKSLTPTVLNPPQISVILFSNKNKNYNPPNISVYLFLHKKKKKKPLRTGPPKAESIHEVNYYPHLDGDISDVTFSRISFGETGKYPRTPASTNRLGRFRNGSPTLFSTPATSRERNTRSWLRHWDEVRAQDPFPIESMTFFVCVVTAHKHLCPQSSFGGREEGGEGSVSCLWPRKVIYYVSISDLCLD